MKNSVKALLILVGVMAFAVSAQAWEREQMSVNELTNATIKNASGTTILNTASGTIAADITGDITGDVTGDVTGDIDGTTGVFYNTTTHTKAVFGTTTTTVINNTGINTSGSITAGAGNSMGDLSATDLNIRSAISSTSVWNIAQDGQATFDNMTAASAYISGATTGIGTATFGNTTTAGFNNGKVFVNGNTFTVMTTTINGIVRNLLYY